MLRSLLTSRPKEKSSYLKIDVHHTEQHNKSIKEEIGEGEEDIQQSLDERCPDMKEEIVDTTNHDVANENSESKVLVPEVKVSNVYDHVLEINPYEFASLQGYQTVPELVESEIYFDNESSAPGPSPKKKQRRKRASKFSKQDLESGDASRRPKTSVERGREFRARKALLKQLSAQQQETNAIIDITTDDNPSVKCKCQILTPPDVKTSEKRARSAEATRRWREKKRGVSEESKKEAKTAAERMREYRERKNYDKNIHHMIEYNPVNDINIIGESSYQDGKEDIQESIDEEFQIKSARTQSPVTLKQTEYASVKEEAVDIENDTNNYVANENAESKLLVPGIKVSNVYDHVLEINPYELANFNCMPKQDDDKNIHHMIEYNPVNDINIIGESSYQDGKEIKLAQTQSPVILKRTECASVKEDTVDIENDTNNYVANENAESKLLVPEIKVSNVYDHVLEINPYGFGYFKCVPEKDGPSIKNITTYTRQDLESSETQSTDYESRRETTMNPSIEIPKRNRKRKSKREDKVPKTNAERQQIFRQKQKEKQKDETLDLYLARKKNNVERSRRYRERKKSRIQRGGFDLVSSSNIINNEGETNRCHGSSSEELVFDTKSSSRHTLQQSEISEDYSTDTIIKEEVCSEEVSQYVQNSYEQLFIKSEHQSDDEQTEYQMENQQILIKQEVSCGDYDLDDNKQDNSMVEISTNPGETLNAITVEVDVNHRHFSQFSAPITTISDFCVKETQATSGLSSIHRGYPKTAAERMQEYRARKKKKNSIMNHQKHRKSDAERAKEYRARRKAKIQSAESWMEISTNPEESLNAITVEVDVNHRHRSQLSAPMTTTSHACANETRARSDLSSSYRSFPKTAAERMQEYRARKKMENSIVNHQKHRKSSAERAKEYRARKKAKIQSADSKSPSHYTVQQSTVTISEDYCTDTIIKEEVCPEEVSEDFQNYYEQPDDDTEYQIENEEILEIKQEIPCDDYDLDDNKQDQRARLKKDVRIKTPAERSREYRARKKARQNSANLEPSSNIPETLQETSEDSQELDNPHMMGKKRKTPADYSREYRARKKALRLLQKESEKEKTEINTIKPKTAAERSRDYRARKRGPMDLIEPIPIAPCIEMTVPINPGDQHSILPDIDDVNDTNIPSVRDVNDPTECCPDSKKDLHVLHHAHSSISNKFSDEISNKKIIKEEKPDTQLNAEVQVNDNEGIQIETEYIQSAGNSKMVDIRKYKTNSASGNEENKRETPEMAVNNLYDHILEIKEEVPCEYNNFDDNPSIDSTEMI